MSASKLLLAALAVLGCGGVAWGAASAPMLFNRFSVQSWLSGAKSCEKPFEPLNTVSWTCDGTCQLYHNVRNDQEKSEDKKYIKCTIDANGDMIGHLWDDENCVGFDMTLRTPTQNPDGFLTPYDKEGCNKGCWKDRPDGQPKIISCGYVARGPRFILQTWEKAAPHFAVGCSPLLSPSTTTSWTCDGTCQPLDEATISEKATLGIENTGKSTMKYSASCKVEADGSLSGTRWNNQNCNGMGKPFEISGFNKDNCDVGCVESNAGFSMTFCGNTDPPSLQQAAYEDWVRFHARPLDEGAKEKVADKAKAAMVDAKLVANTVVDALADATGAAKKDSKNRLVIGFGEADHGIRDCPMFRNDLFFALVEKGFRTIMLESGILESRLVDNYINGDDALSPHDVLIRGFTHFMGPVQDVQDLVDRMRSYNEENRLIGKPNRLRFIGYDLTVIGDAPYLPLKELKQHLTENSYKDKAKDQEFLATLDKAVTLAARASAVMEELRQKYKIAVKKPNVPDWRNEIDPDLLDAVTQISYEQLSLEEQTELKGLVSQIVTGMKDPERKKRLEKCSNKCDYVWLAHLPEIAEHHIKNFESRMRFGKITDYDKAIEMLKKAGFALEDAGNADVPSPDTKRDLVAGKIVKTNRAKYVLRRLADGKSFNVDDFKQYHKGRESRERMAADNVMWAVNNFGNAFIYAHNGHLMKSDIAISVGGQYIGRTGSKGQGQFLAEELGRKYYFVGTTLERMNVKVEPDKPLVHLPSNPIWTEPECIEGAFAKGGYPADKYFMDFHKLWGSSKEWLSSDRPVRWQAAFQKVIVSAAFDGLLWFRNEYESVKLADIVEGGGKVKKLSRREGGLNAESDGISTEMIVVAVAAAAAGLLCIAAVVGMVVVKHRHRRSSSEGAWGQKSVPTLGRRDSMTRRSRQKMVRRSSSVKRTRM